jgi:hypothetical protein
VRVGGVPRRALRAGGGESTCTHKDMHYKSRVVRGLPGSPHGGQSEQRSQCKPHAHGRWRGDVHTITTSKNQSRVGAKCEVRISNRGSKRIPFFSWQAARQAARQKVHGARSMHAGATHHNNPQRPLSVLVMELCGLEVWCRVVRTKLKLIQQDHTTY